MSPGRCPSASSPPADPEGFPPQETLPEAGGEERAKSSLPPTPHNVPSYNHTLGSQPPTHSGLRASPPMPGPRRLPLTQGQGCPQFPCPGRSPQKPPGSLGFRQSTFNPIPLLSLHSASPPPGAPSTAPEPLLWKLTAGASVSAWEPGGALHILALTPEAARNLTFPCPPLPGRGSKPPPSPLPHAQSSAGSGLSPMQRRSPGATIRMGLSRLAAGAGAPGRATKTHTRLCSPEASPEARHTGSQEAGKTHVNTRPQSQADALCAPAPSQGGRERRAPELPSQPEARR